ncbi:MAG: APHP domain-containing protein, partial [Rhodobacteraceae bacterium]|nr:APHP domain-containing protein [Paracoccaceae bacterium]
EDTLASNLNPDDINELDNNNYKARAIDVIGGFAPPPPDLRITALAASPLASTDAPLSVTWTVANTGAGEAAGSWNDVFWLSDKPTLDAPGARQWYLGAVAHDGGAAPGASYTQSTSFALNPAAAGRYLLAYTDYNPFKPKPYDVAEGDEENNTRVQDTGVVAQPADLQVVTIAAPSVNYSGEKTTVSWTVKNFGGAVWQGSRYWLDSVYLSPDPVFLPERATSLGTFVHSNAAGLAAGASYTESAEVTLPRGIGGNFYLYVITDANRYDPRYPAGEAGAGDNAYYRDVYYPTSVYEGVGGQDNNRGIGSIPVTYREPDLKVTSLLVPSAGGQSGSTVTVNYTVTNIGNRDTRESSWWDRLFLSRDDSLDTFDLQVAEARHYGVLTVGDSYTGTATVSLPEGIAGAFSLLAFTDSEADSRLAWWNSNIVPEYRGVGIDANSDTVPEFRGEGNNITVAALPVAAAPLADLQVTAVSAPNHITVGNDFTVTYTVSNLGGADTPAAQARWDDLIYLSRDPLLDLDSDRYLLTVEHTGGLAQGDSYTVSKTLRAPLDISGAYYVFVVTDPARGSGRGKVFEGGFERNNATPNSPPSIFELPPPADIQVEAISFAGAGAAGDTIHVEWTVANHSINPTASGWTDAVYLSDDNLWDINDRLLGKIAHSGVLAENDSYTASLDALVPPIKGGQYRLIVRPDIYNEVFEGPYRSAGEANNFATSANALSIAVDELHLGVALSTTLSTAQSRVYKLTVGQGETLKLSLTAADHDAANEIFIRYGDVPDGFNYDATYENPLQANQTAVIPFTRPGDYYVLIRGHSEPKANAQVKLLAEVVPFAITAVSVDQGGDSRWVTIDVRGARFADNAILKLVRPNVAEYEPVKWDVIDSTWIRATFDFRGAPLGLYDLKVINPDGKQAVVAYRFLIERALEPDVTIGLGGPRVLAAGETGTYGVALQSLTN